MPDPWNFSRRSSPRPDTLAQTPLLTVLLCGLSVLVTLAALTSGDQPGSLWHHLGNFGYASPDAIWDGRLWGLVTTVFIHGDWLHLLFNMIWLYQLGRILENTLSPVVYLLFLVSAAVVGSTCEMLISGSTGIGMSGVVYAMFGLMWAGRGGVPAWGAVATPENLRLFVLWGLFCVGATWLNLLHIANGAHGGGFLFGLCIGFLFFSPRRRHVWAAPLALLLAASVLAVTWLPWSRDWTFWKGNHEFQRGHYAQAIRWYNASLSRGGDAESNWYNIGLSWANIARAADGRGDGPGAQKARAEEAAAERKAGPDTGGQ